MYIKVNTSIVKYAKTCDMADPLGKKINNRRLTTTKHQVNNDYIWLYDYTFSFQYELK